MVRLILVMLTMVMISGCAQLGITSSFRSSFTETVDPETGNIEVTVWEQHVRNGLFSKIDEAAFETAYRTFDENGNKVQEIEQGANALGMDSTGQIEALKATMDGLSALTQALAPLINPAGFLP